VINTVRATLIKAARILNAFAFTCILRGAETFLVCRGRPLEERNGKANKCRCDAQGVFRDPSHLVSLFRQIFNKDVSEFPLSVRNA
jgi:hypothetical protein